ncbi:Sporulation protein YlmC, PRC-barrel domain family [Micromonospora nigra]|uniref:Sporulation protein YlmC, PRC-barrel domain family n=1 Tax=Micromonospora nigra TaxID=145857 RepID=A0A1C6S818_9ACTN|nr:PRC-barrel domain-containing protein [Micromonospora nigra]SCL25598.1 Sporulation protein YlmC, PRC-barrel domain family [Micromonospora nigra]
MTRQSSVSLIKLGDSDQVLVDPTEDIRGHRVRDRDGNDLGKVDDLLIDSEQHKVRMLRVEHGGILGFGATPSFIPVDAVTSVSDDLVCVGEPRDRVSEAPRYDPDLVDESEYYESLYGYYGVAPYWSAGYVYPPYPYYRF